MADIPISPMFVDASTLIIDQDDYAAHISGATAVPTTSTVTWTGAAPGAVFTRQTKPTWALTVNYAQDWESAESFSQYLHEHQGETKDIVFAPVDGGQAFGITTIIAPGTIGGEINTFGTSTVTLGISGAPEKVATPAGA